ncbi:translation initiation factor IF-3 [Diorhabda carinulata]|uniref:translation initiation factor IF-3 n=1 Tax=Diorhabda carinulata TaxID=1163345 RepID=UPI0025A057BA|nr:translation initiation factor IF-3 [Diorhabda carinulata]
MSVRYLSKTFKLITTSLTRGTFTTNVGARNVSNIINNFDKNDGLGAEEKPKKKKTAIIPKITLIQDQQLSVTTLEEAQRLSKRRNLKLVKIIDLDTKTQRPIYKLMTGSEYHAEDLKQRAIKKEEKQNAVKAEKVLIINHNIYEHDLQVHLKKINKWIDKLHEVRVVINGDSNNMEKAESVYANIEKALSTGNSRILQKRTKGSDIKFQILPPKKNKDDNL